MAEALNPDGVTPVYVGDVMLLTPGLLGEAEVYLPETGGLRGEEQTAEAFVSVLSDTGFVEQLTVAITDPAEIDGNGGTRGGGGGDELTVEVPGPGDNFAQVMLYTAEDGTQTWHLPDPPQPLEGIAAPGPTARNTYRIPRAVFPPQSEDPGSRGLLAAVGKKVLKVLAFPLVELGSAFVADLVAQRWEAKNRPYRLRSFDPDDYGRPQGRPLTAADWTTLAQGPALLFIHGTFSTAAAGFRNIPPATFAKLYAQYGGRVLALDHPTLSASPTDNARWLAQQFPPGVKITADIIAHSRGGLVAREICEYAADTGLAGKLDVRRAVMVGTPNAGTALANSAHWAGYIDRMTNILQFVPDNPVTDTMDAVLTVLKHVALGAVKGLDGLTAMDPTGDYLLQRLNLASAVAQRGTYLAVASNYEPPAGSPLLRVVRDGLTDRVFGSTQNDLVVPTDGVFTVPGVDGFPIAEPLVFPPSAGVEHTTYFGVEELANRLLTWLAAA